MSTPSDDPDASTNAEELFFAYLLQREEPEAEDFESLCARHPEHADAMRVLYADLERVGGLLSKSSKQDSMQATLASLFGKSLDPGIMLEPAKGTSDSMVERLEEHAPGVTRYEIEGEVARGGMGVILKAWDRDLRRSMAMKALLAEHATDEDSPRPKVNEMHLRRFLGEAQITGQLEHPGIVPVHELGIDSEGRVYFTMPLVRGREFKRIISLVRDGAEGWTLNKALHVLQKVCEAVAYAHAKGVIHRDLKPANIMVGSFGETYVMDWGLARVLDRKDTRNIRVRPPGEAAVETDRTSGDTTPLMTMDGAVIGTPAYMSPEQAAGRVEQLDERTDVYSLGAMLYNLLAFQMPYVARGQFLSPSSVLRSRLNGPPLAVAKINPEAPTEVVEICEKAMSDAPGDRYRTALELAQDLEAYLGGRAVSAHETSFGYQLALAYKRHRPVFVTVIASIVLLLVGAGMFVRYQQGVIRERTRALDSASASALPRQVDDLFPVLPSSIPALRSWILQADELLSREEEWQRGLEEADDELRAELEQIVARMGAIPAHREVVVERLELAEALQDPAYLDRGASWASATKAIASSSKYGGLVLSELPGLIPLGEDPGSGLWEFWSPLCGERPQRAPETGLIVPRAEDGIVMVLIPGGTFMMGSPDTEYVAFSEEMPQEVTLRPFLAGKYEVTQAQWVHVMGANPSMYSAGVRLDGKVLGEREADVVVLTHPAESFTWFEASECASRLGMTLLSEEQWEYACRAGTITAFAWGDSPESLKGMANIGNLGCESVSYGSSCEWEDGFCFASPVGSFPPNPFGLHDMEGNIMEWCESWFEDDWIKPRRRKIFRGGGYMIGPDEARSARRGFDVPAAGSFGRGMRVGLTLPD